MSDNGDIGVVRARRVEVVDEWGRPRLVLGDIGNPEGPGEVFGIAVVDPAGRHRAWLALDDTGAALVFDRTGNAVAELGVDDNTGDALAAGAYFHLCDLDGRPVVGWRVEDDGDVTVRTGGDEA